MSGFPNLVPHARTAAILMSVAAAIAVIIQLTVGYLTVLPFSTVILSVLGLLVMFAVEAFITVYGINCMTVGSLPTNNCGVYSKAQAILVSFIFALVIVVSSMSLFSLWFFGERAQVSGEDEEKPVRTVAGPDIAPTRLLTQTGNDSRAA